MPIRMLIKITSVGQRKQVPNKDYHSLEFFGEHKGQEYKFNTYKSIVMNAIEVGKEVEVFAEIEPMTPESEKREPSRVVTGIVESVRTAKQSTPTTNNFRKPINKDESIEAQLAAREINLRAVHDKDIPDHLKIDPELVKLADKFFKNALNRVL